MYSQDEEDSPKRNEEEAKRLTNPPISPTEAPSGSAEASSAAGPAASSPASQRSAQGGESEPPSQAQGAPPEPARRPGEPLPPIRSPEEEAGAREASQATAEVYVQAPRHFKVQSRSEVAAAIAEAERRRLAGGGGLGFGEAEVDDQGLGRVLVAQTALLTIGVWLQGLLSGWTLCEAMVLGWLAPPWEAQLKLLSSTALARQTAIYVAASVAALASLDRYDVASDTLRMLKRAATLQSGALAVLVYVGVLVVTLVMGPVDERLELFRSNPLMLYPDGYDAADPGATIRAEAESLLGLYRIGVFVRAGLASLGWLLVAARPSTHLLHKHLTQDCLADAPRDPAQEPAHALPEKDPVE